MHQATELGSLLFPSLDLLQNGGSLDDAFYYIFNYFILGN